MSKKYVPSFLKEQVESGVLSPFDPPECAPAFPDAFTKKKKNLSNHMESDAFPMNRNRKPLTDFDAFNKVKKMPENNAFSMNKRTTTNDDDFDAFTTKKKTNDDFPMNKRTNEKNAFQKRSKENTFTANILPSTTSFLPGTLASLTATALIIPANLSSDDQGSSFAAKFAQKMKIVDDPDYVPPPITVNVSSEEEFPTLGGPPSTKSTTNSLWSEPSKIVKHAEEWHTILEKQRIEKENIHEQQELARHKRRIAKLNATSNHSKKIPIIPSKIHDQKTEEEFIPIEYEEDGFDSDDGLYASDVDEEEFFGDEEDDEEEEDEFNPNIYDDRRHRDELY